MLFISFIGSYIGFEPILHLPQRCVLTTNTNNSIYFFVNLIGFEPIPPCRCSNQLSYRLPRDSVPHRFRHNYRTSDSCTPDFYRRLLDPYNQAYLPIFIKPQSLYVIDKQFTTIAAFHKTIAFGFMSLHQRGLHIFTSSHSSILPTNI